MVDLAQANIDLAALKAEKAGVSIATRKHANALDLAELADGSYDSVLLMGPLYHLLQEDQRRLAVKELEQAARKGGLLFATFINVFSVFRWSAQDDPTYMLTHPDYIDQVLRTGYNPAEEGGFTDAFFIHPSAVIPFMESCGLRTLALIGCEGVVARAESKVNALLNEDFVRWVEIHYRLGCDPALLGAADHLLYIGNFSNS